MNVIKKNEEPDYREPMIERYKRNVSTDGGNVWFVDRVTGQEILQYNARAPENLPPVGYSDKQRFEALGLDLFTLVPVRLCKIKPRGTEAMSYVLREVLDTEREEEIQRGKELLAELDIYSYLGVEAALLDRMPEEKFEQEQLLPALVAKGFTMVAFFRSPAGERGMRGIYREQGHVFYY